MNIRKAYWVSKDFDKKLQEMQEYMKDVCHLDYTVADLFDEMMSLYEARMKFNANILNELFREHDEAMLDQFLISNAEMLNSLKEYIEGVTR